MAVTRRIIRIIEKPDTGAVPDARFIENVVSGHGADETGVSDSTAPIQAAIAALPT